MTKRDILPGVAIALNNQGDLKIGGLKQLQCTAIV